MTVSRITIAAFCLCLQLPAAAYGQGSVGLNLPPTQGSSGTGAFLPGVYTFDYDADVLAEIRRLGYTHFRICINVETANDANALRRIESIFSALGNRGTLCMFDTNEADETDHGNGRPNDIEAMAQAWRKINDYFKSKENIAYELFNEPFGYPRNPKGAAEYMRDMRSLMSQANLPQDRCIINGLGYSSDIKSVVADGWDGAVGYHFYPMWIPKGGRTREGYKKCFLDSVEGIPNEIHVTEFGGRLNHGDVYASAFDSDQENVATLNGLSDALIELQTDNQQQIQAMYHWHGWDNGDSYSIWGQQNRFGVSRVREIQTSGQ